MKYVTFLQNGAEHAGILASDGQSVHSFADVGLPYPTLLAFIQNHTRQDVEALAALAAAAGTPLASVQLLAPIPQPHHDILCVGLNYMDHVKESVSVKAISQGQPDIKREEAVYFSKRVTRAVGPDGVIQRHGDLETRLDYEAELGVVIGRQARRVTREEAWSHVFGLCCFNDVSARDQQLLHKQWYFGKSLDSFTVFGPWIASADEFTWPLRLRIGSRVNGEVRQQSNTEHMIFPVDYLISELSSGITLDAGSIIATGTPAGVGAGFEPPRCLQPGDVCEIEVEGCGVLRNTVE